VRPVLLSALLVVFAGCHTAADDPFARASVIDRLDGGVGGPKALAQPGDFLLENDRLRIAVLATRDSMGPGLYGGSIADADVQWNDPRFPPGKGNDQLAEMFTTVNMNVIHPVVDGDVSIIADGSDGGPAIVRVQGAGEPFITLLGALWAIVNAPDFGIVTDYIVEPGKPWVTIRTTATVGWDGVTPLSADGTELEYSDADMPLLEWAVEDGVAVGDFYLQGGSIDVFAPDMGFDEDGEVYAADQRGENTITDPFRFDFVAGVGDGISYGIAPKEGSAFVPLFTSSQTAMFGAGTTGDGTDARFPPGSTFTYERYFFVGTGDVGSILDGYLEARGLPSGHVSGHVVELDSDLPVSGADVFAYKVVDGVVADRPYSEWRTDVDPRDSVADGSFGGQLPPGDWSLIVHKEGHTDSEPVRLHVAEGADLTVALGLPQPGVLTFTVRDELGRLVPAKVTLFRDDAAPTRDPILGDAYVGGSPQDVLFAEYGDGSVALPPGRYHAVASRGIEYELGVSAPFDIDDRTSQHVDLTVVHSVDTEGWVSADLHVHSQPSHDSGVKLPDRVRTMVCEGVEFFSSTDHDFVTDFAPVVEDMGLEEWVQTAVGNEVTTIEIGHFLGFPLDDNQLADAHGAMDWTGKTPYEIVSALRSAGIAGGTSPVIWVGHPRDGILGYFDQYGLNPYEGAPGFAGAPGTAQIDRPVLSRTNTLLAPENMDWSFDALELLNGKRMELIRTPTQPELDRYAAGEDVPIHELIERTMAEQQDLIDDTYRLGYGQEGQIDDWFTLLNLGFTYTAIGNSDTHGMTHIESGCPRNFVLSETDDPAFIDDQAVADAVKAHRVVASYGPFVRFDIDDHGIGDTFTPSAATVTATIDVQAPTWIAVDRVNLYENGTLIHEWAVPETGDVYRFHESLDLTPAADAWYVVEVVGDDDLSPVFTPIEMPEIQLQTVVVGALGGVPAVASLMSPAIPIPTTYPVIPYAITNPIWVDLQGNGFDPPGVPSWMRTPVASDP
jgi:hypothetical protein